MRRAQARPRAEELLPVGARRIGALIGAALLQHRDQLADDLLQPFREDGAREVETIRARGLRIVDQPVGNTRDAAHHWLLPTAENELIDEPALGEGRPCRA